MPPSLSLSLRPFMALKNIKLPQELLGFARALQIPKADYGLEGRGGGKLLWISGCFVACCLVTEVVENMHKQCKQQ